MTNLVSRGVGCILYWLSMAIQMDRSFPWAEVRPEALVRPEATAAVIILMLAGAVIGGICCSLAAEAVARAVRGQRATTWNEDEAVVVWAVVTTLLALCLMMLEYGITAGRGLGFALLVGVSVAVVLGFWALQPTTDEVRQPHRTVAVPR